MFVCMGCCYIMRVSVYVCAILCVRACVCVDGWVCARVCYSVGGLEIHSEEMNFLTERRSQVFFERYNTGGWSKAKRRSQ